MKNNTVISVFFGLPNVMFLLVIKSSYVGSILWYFSKNNTVTLKQYKNSDLPTPFQNETEIGNKTIFRPHMQNEKKVNRIPGSTTSKMRLKSGTRLFLGLICKMKKKLIEFQGVPQSKTAGNPRQNRKRKRTKTSTCKTNKQMPRST